MNLTRMTRNAADAVSMLARNVHECECVLGETPWRITVTPLHAGGSVPFGPRAWEIAIRWAGAAFLLKLAATAVDEWVQGLFPSLDLPGLPQELQAAAVESALEDLLAALESAGEGTAARVESAQVTESWNAPAAPHTFRACLQHDGATVWASIATDELGLMLMAGLAARAVPAEPPPASEGLPLLLRAEVGCTRLTVAELASLATGDAVVLDEPASGRDGQLWLRCGDWGLRVRMGDAGAVVTAPFQPMENIMKSGLEEEEAVDPHDGGPAVSLDGLPLRVRFDVGQRTLTLGQLRALQVGEVLDLGTPPSRSVNIRANGALIGTGELVEVGDGLAVSITSIHAPRQEGHS